MNWVFVSHSFMTCHSGPPWGSTRAAPRARGPLPAGGPAGGAREPLRGGHDPEAPAPRVRRLEDDVPVPVLEEGDPGPVGGPHGHRPVPRTLDDPAPATRRDLQDADVPLLVTVRAE